ncbi:hypothetical protein GGR58DRAFT_480699 [Xylaria digitata]|nr:hypothetical protein GGR58DRAFT_480699 [Xylaria digitata]
MHTASASMVLLAYSTFSTALYANGARVASFIQGYAECLHGKALPLPDFPSPCRVGWLWAHGHDLIVSRKVRNRLCWENLLAPFIPVLPVMSYGCGILIRIAYSNLEYVTLN